MQHLLESASEVANTTLAACTLAVAGWLGLLALSYAGKSDEPICRAAAAVAREALRPGLFAVWSLMVLAMMGPLLAGPFYHLWHRSLARHRIRAIALFVIAYLAASCAVYVLFVLALDAAKAYQLTDAVAVSIAVFVAAVWQFSPQKRYALLRCHLRPPLAVFGNRAWLDPIWFALRLAVWCISSCWALMLVSFTAPRYGLVIMLMTSVLILFEQIYRAPRRPLSLWPMQIA